MNIEQVKKRFSNQGKTYTAWAHENGFKPSTVIAVLNGTNKGRFGQGHQVAVALGLKKDARGDK